MYAKMNLCYTHNSLRCYKTLLIVNFTCRACDFGKVSRLRQQPYVTFIKFLSFIMPYFGQYLANFCSPLITA